MKTKYLIFELCCPGCSTLLNVFSVYIADFGHLIEYLKAYDHDNNYYIVFDDSLNCVFKNFINEE